MSAMTADEARERFGDAAEGGLGDAKEAFEAALASDAELREEYELYKKMIGGSRALGDEEAKDASPPPALLEGVQRKIRTRSKGRFYRDRFASEGKGPMLSLVLAMAILLLIATTIVIVQQLVVVELP